jgi:hypothetical protein
LHASVGDHVPGHFTDFGTNLAEKVTDLFRGRLTKKDCESQDPARVMIDNQRQPPAELSTLTRN